MLLFYLSIYLPLLRSWLLHPLNMTDFIIFSSNKFMPIQFIKFVRNPRQKRKTKTKNKFLLLCLFIFDLSHFLQWIFYDFHRSLMSTHTHTCTHMTFGSDRNRVRCYHYYYFSPLNVHPVPLHFFPLFNNRIYFFFFCFCSAFLHICYSAVE